MTDDPEAFTADDITMAHWKGYLAGVLSCLMAVGLICIFALPILRALEVCFG